MRLFSAPFLITLSSAEVCSVRDMTALNGGPGLMDLIVSCSLKQNESIVDVECLSSKLDAVALSDECTECLAESIPGISEQIVACIGDCNTSQLGVDCVQCKEELGFEMEKICVLRDDVKTTLPAQAAVGLDKPLVAA